MIALVDEMQAVTFEDFLEQRLRSLMKLARVLCGSSAAGEDVLQDVLLRAHQQWARIGSLQHPYAYVRTMLVHEHLSWRRRTSRMTPVAELDPGLRPDHAEHLADRSDLRQRLERLPAQQRTAIALRFYADLDDAEIAEALGCSRGTVRSHISRGLAALRVGIDDRGPSITKDSNR